LQNSQDQSNPYLSDSDVCLMLEFQRGQKASFETLMKKYFPRILNFIYRYVGSREIAEELTQEVFIKVFKNVARYQPQSKFQTWVFTIAKNISLNELRKNKFKHVSMDEKIHHDGDQIMRQIEDTRAVRPDEGILKNERVAAIKEAIDSLPENQRIAVLLRRYEDLSYEEIAETMNLSLEAVKSLLNRAKENLKLSLANLMKNN